MLTYKIHLFRHGITRANLEGRYVGLSDYPLCQEGIDALKEYVKDKDYPPVEKIYTSPLRRCRETAHVLYPGYKAFDVPQLMEMDFGTYEGKTLDELQNDESFIAWSRDSMHNAQCLAGMAFSNAVDTVDPEAGIYPEGAEKTAKSDLIVDLAKHVGIEADSDDKVFAEWIAACEKLNNL